MIGAPSPMEAPTPSTLVETLPPPLPSSFVNAPSLQHELTSEAQAGIQDMPDYSILDQMPNGHQSRTYKSMVLGNINGNNIHTNLEQDNGYQSDTDNDSFTIIEGKHGKYDCPKFCLSMKEAQRIQKPWKNGLIVKLLGKRIGFKALETRLTQLWTKNSALGIIDLGHDYFLVVFSNDADRERALNGGPWMIYDHYLTVRNWCPDFQPTNEPIRKVAVWVRFSQLPIEYYDAKMLHFIGDRIGKTLKVDRTTLQQERVKYARI